MNGLIVLAAIGGGLYLYDRNRRKKKATAAAVAENQPIVRNDMRALPGCPYVEIIGPNVGAFFEAMWNRFVEQFGPDGVPPTVANAEALLTSIMVEVFPECAWPPTNPGFYIRDVTPGEEVFQVSWPELVEEIRSDLEAFPGGVGLAMAPGMPSWRPRIFGLGGRR